MSFAARTRDLSPATLGAILFGFSFLVWLPSVANGFVWDDVNNLVSSDRLMKLRAFFEVFLHDAMWSAEREQASIGTYRPIALASFVIDFQLFGRKAGGFHLTSVIWHSLAALVLFRAFLKFASPVAAFALAALWAAHPAGAEATAWINGRSEVFAVLFGAGALACAGVPRLTPLRWMGTALCLLGALLSKEAGLVFVPVVVWLSMESTGRASRGWPFLILVVGLAAAWFFKEIRLVPLAVVLWLGTEAALGRQAWPWQRFLLMTAASGVAMGVYLLMRKNALEGGVAPGVAYSPEAAAALAPVWGRSFLTTLLPLDRSLQHLSLWLQALDDTDRHLYLAGSVALGGAVVGFWVTERRIAAVGLLWWMISLLPVALIAPKSWPGYYRWLVIGMPGLLLFFYHGFRGLVPHRLALGVASVALLGAVFLTQRAIPVWRTGGSLFKTMMDEHPEIDYGYVGYGAWLIEVGRDAEAEEVLRKGLTLDYARPDMWLFLARAISSQNRCDEAVEAAENKVAGRIPAHVAYSLARCYEVNRLWDQAVVAYGKCADYVPICKDRLPIAVEWAAKTKAAAPSVAPATQAPASEAPASEAPASEAPASEAPASEAPASEAPASEAPASGQE